MNYPNKIYHIVPEYIYERSINKLGNYNCRGFENSKFIHTTWDLEELQRIANIIFTKTEKYPSKPSAVGKYYERPSVKFLMLVIDRKEIKAKIGFRKPSYLHIHGSIPKNAYHIEKVKRDKSGRFLLTKL